MDSEIANVLDIEYPNWRDFSNKLEWRDTRILNKNSIFEVLDAKRKSDQDKKDFINDQDSVSGPGVIDNLIKNILSVRRGTFSGDTRFGIAVDSILFEQLDWANLEFIRTVVLSNLNNQLPDNITITHIELSSNDVWDTLNISIAYNIKLGDGPGAKTQQPGPEVIGGRKAYISLNLNGVKGSNKF